MVINSYLLAMFGEEGVRPMIIIINYKIIIKLNI